MMKMSPVGLSASMEARKAHELRNEVVEELISNLMNESCAEREAPRVGGGRNRRMESQRGRR